jgi:hypothetical protein
VIPQLGAWKFVGLKDDLEYKIEMISINHCVGNKEFTLKLADSTVKGTRSFLTHSKAKPSTAPQLWNGVVRPEQWRKIWRWVWMRYRNRKVSDFLWKLFNKALYLRLRQAPLRVVDAS